MNENTDSSTTSLLADAAAYDPIEDRLRASVRATIETMFEEELTEFLGRIRYGRGGRSVKGCRHGHRIGSSPAPSAPRRYGCRAPGLRSRRARSRNGGRRRCRATSASQES